MIITPFTFMEQKGDSTPSVITAGLKFYVDAGNASSYPGTGTVWYDLSGNLNNFTLTNGPTYNAGSGGYFSFDGTNDYAIGLTYALGSGFTIDCWINTTTTATDAILAQPDSGTLFFGTRNNKLGISGQFDIPWGFVLSTSNINTGNWVYGAATYDGVNVKMYVNGTLETTSAQTGNFTSQTLRIADSGASEYYTGNISIVRLYTTVLSGTDITQNYNAQKSRYGY